MVYNVDLSALDNKIQQAEEELALIKRLAFFVLPNEPKEVAAYNRLYDFAKDKAERLYYDQIRLTQKQQAKGAKF